MTDATRNESMLLTLPDTWMQIIEQQTKNTLKTRQDIIREWIEPHILKKQGETKQKCNV